MKKLIVTFLCMALFLGGCGSASATENNTEQTAFTINGEEISLREWNFYIRMNQMIWEKDDLEEAGDDMWSQEVSDDGTRAGAGYYRADSSDEPACGRIRRGAYRCG